MSRWSKRSDEEKVAIMRKQQETQHQVAARATEHCGGGILDLVGERGSAAATAIYEAQEIPMPCRTCGWVGSDQYAFYKGEPFPGAPPMDMIKGRCRKCGRPLQRVFPSNEELMLFMMAASVLKMRGRLTDAR